MSNSDIRRWYYSDSNTSIGSEPLSDIGTEPEAWFTCRAKAAYWVDHPGFPGVVVSDDDHDGEPCLFGPVPGRDFVSERPFEAMTEDGR